MEMRNFSSFIEILGALYFGFIGLKFLRAYYESHKYIVDNRVKLLGYLNDSNEPKSIKEFLDKEKGLYFEVLFQRLTNHNYYRFREIFLKAAILCIFTLIFIGCYNKDNQDSNLSFIMVGSLFIMHSTYRSSILLSKLNSEKFAHYISHDLSEKMINLYIIDGKHWLKLIFSRRRIKEDFTWDLLFRLIFFVIFNVILFHLFYFTFKNINLVHVFIQDHKLHNFTVLSILTALIFPYFLMFFIDTIQRTKLSNILKEIENKESEENAAEVKKLVNVK